MIHECVRSKDISIFKCRACSFNGTLERAIEHIVQNQFEVKSVKSRK